MRLGLNLAAGVNKLINVAAIIANSISKLATTRP